MRTSDGRARGDAAAGAAGQLDGAAGEDAARVDGVGVADAAPVGDNGPDQATQVADSALVASAREGDAEAFGRLVARYAPLVQAVCRALVGVEAAPDLAQDAFVAAWFGLPALRDPARLPGWLRTLTVNECRMWRRQRATERQALARLEHGAAAAVADTSEAPSRLAAGLARLSQDHRLALALHYGEGLACEQIAAFLDVSVGTVMSRLHRARARLRQGAEAMAGDDRGDREADLLRRTVVAEIEALLRLSEQAVRAEPVGGNNVYRLPACRKLGALLNGSPELVRSVLAAIDPVLAPYVANRLRHAGQAAIGVAVSCALAGDPDLRRPARQVLGHLLARGVDQANRDPYFTLPLRLPAEFLLDALVSFPAAAEDKVALLADLLPGCQDDATVILMGSALLCWPDLSLPSLWQRWRSAASEGGPVLAVLARFGVRFLALLGPELASHDPARVVRALDGTRAVARLVGRSVLTRSDSTDAALEWRTGGGLLRDAIDPQTRGLTCEALTRLLSHPSAAVRTAAAVALGGLGGTECAPALERLLAHADPGTRVAAIRGLASAGDAARVQRLAAVTANPAEETLVRRAAVQALRQLEVAEADETLLLLIGDPELQSEAIAALGELGTPAADAALAALGKGPDRTLARLAATAICRAGAQRSVPSPTTCERLRRVRGQDARPLLHISVVGALRSLPQDRSYREPELTRYISSVCGDFSTTRRELIMNHLMARQDGVYEMTEAGRAVWRVERWLADPDSRIGRCSG